MAQKDEASRLTDVEMSLTHLQKDFETLSDTVWQQNKLLESLNRKIESLTRQMQSSDEGDEERDLLAEKPPHY